MQKLEKLVPEKISLIGNKIVMSEKIFDSLVSVINLQTNTINNLIDNINEEHRHIERLEENVSQLKSATQRLAEALKVYTEE